MENLLTFCGACVHTDAGKRCVFIWFKVIWLCSGWGDICLWSNSSWRDASVWGWDSFLHFPGTNDSSFPEEEHTNALSLSLILSLCLSIGHTLTTCAHWLHLHIEWQCECTSSTNESLYYSAIMMIFPFCVLHHAAEGSAQIHSPQ